MTVQTKGRFLSMWGSQVTGNLPLIAFFPDNSLKHRPINYKEFGTLTVELRRRCLETKDNSRDWVTSFRARVRDLGAEGDKNVVPTAAAYDF